MSFNHRPWLLLAMLTPLVAQALESDSKEPIYVDSDTATYDDQKGIAIYTGNVHSVQGTLVTDSHQMTVYLIQGQIDKIYAVGNPRVHIVQTPEDGKGTIDATSEKAEYYPKEYRLILIDKAIVLQSGNTYTSDRIEYDTHNSVAVAGEKTSGNKRVHTIIGPKGPEAPAAPAGAVPPAPAATPAAGAAPAGAVPPAPAPATPAAPLSLPGKKP